MKNVVRIFLITMCFMFCAISCFALELDLSVDEEIRKNYNPSKLEMETLPPLPNITKSTPQNTTPQTQQTQQTYTAPSALRTPPSALPKSSVLPKINISEVSTEIRIKQGTVFKVKSQNAVSDSSRIGTVISFVSQEPVTQTYVTIPAGTIFKGKVVDSHLPQKTANGGLIVISVNSMAFRGSNVRVNAKITKANHKKIFLNNIKGERKYFKSMADSTKAGNRFYKKMARTTSKLANGNGTVLLTPFTVITGVAGYAANVVCSPVLALFKKGGRISIPAGSDFEIKMLEDVYL